MANAQVLFTCDFCRSVGGDKLLLVIVGGGGSVVRPVGGATVRLSRGRSWLGVRWHCVSTGGLFGSDSVGGYRLHLYVDKCRSVSGRQEAAEIWNGTDQNEVMSFQISI